MQILTFSMVFVELAEIHGLKWVTGCFSFVFVGLDRSRSIVRTTALGRLEACLGARNNIHKIGN